MKYNHIKILALTASVLLLNGCGIIMLDSSKNDFPISEEKVPSYKTGQAIDIQNYYKTKKIVILKADRVQADLQQYTNTVIELLSDSLNYRKIINAPHSKKSVRLQVYDVVYDTGLWTIRASLKIKVELGNGKSFIVSHYNPSPFSGYRAVNGAITRATEKILKHPEFLKYMNQ